MNRRTSKPQPPVDLWEQLGKHLAEAVLWHPARPEGSFTAPEFASKFGVSIGAAHYRIQKLQAMGKVRREGTSGRNCYYVLAD